MRKQRFTKGVLPQAARLVGGKTTVRILSSLFKAVCVFRNDVLALWAFKWFEFHKMPLSGFQVMR